MADVEVFTDDFTRGDDTDLGANYATLGSCGDLPVASNECGNGSGVYSNYCQYYSAEAIADDQWAEVEQADLSGFADIGLGPSVRLSGSDGYTCHHAVDAVRLERIASGARTNIGFTLTTGSSGDLWRTRVVGDLVQVDLNGSNEIEVTDANFTSGAPGIYGVGNEESVDNFKCGYVGDPPSTRHRIRVTS